MDEFYYRLHDGSPIYIGARTLRLKGTDGVERLVSVAGLSRPDFPHTKYPQIKKVVVDTRPSATNPNVIEVSSSLEDTGTNVYRRWQTGLKPLPTLAPHQWENFLDDGTNRTGITLDPLRSTVDGAITALRARGDMESFRIVNQARRSPDYMWERAEVITRMTFAAGIPAPNLDSPGVKAELQARWKAAAEDYINDV